MSDAEQDDFEQLRPSALERHPQVFVLLGDFIAILCGWIHDDEIHCPDNPLDYFKFGIGIRALNLIRSIRILMESDHWEDGAILTRSMFELLLNAEEVLRDKEEAQERAQRYLKFGELQKYLHGKKLAEYEVQRGSYDGDVSALLEVEEVMRVIFKEFLRQDKRRKGKSNPRWATSWCGKSVKELADKSRSPMRSHQYTLLYSFTSDLAHGGPIVLQNLIGHNQYFSKHLIEYESKEEQRILEFVSFAILFCSDLFALVGDVFPKYDVKEFLAIRDKVYPLWGRKAPATQKTAE